MDIAFDEYSESFLVRGDFEGEVFSLSIPLQALASWPELLGYENVLDSLDAIIQSRRHPVNEDNLWTDVYAVLSYREQEREKEYFKAEREGTANDPRSPSLRANLQAFHCLPRNEENECVLDQCRREVRQGLGVAHPPKGLSKVRPALQLSGDRLTAPSSCDPDTTCSSAMLDENGRQQAHKVLQDHLSEIDRRRSFFQHSQTSFPENPLPPPEEVFTPEDEMSPEAEALQRLLGIQPEDQDGTS